MADIRLPVVRASDLESAPPERRWLVDSLWARAGVGIIGGPPKACKSWLGLDLALSVASNTPCLGRFEVRDSGPVLVYLAEDGLSSVKQRLLGLCRHRSIDLARIPVDVITASSLRLDLERDRARLDHTLRACRPRLLLLDPFVRLHRIDENSAGDVSALLAFLREMQREHDVAIAVVHHARKNGPAGMDSGQALRGSGDFHAWTDSALYVRRQKDCLAVTVEHRAAPSLAALSLVLAGHGDDVHLDLVDTPDDDASPDTRARLLAALDDAGGVATREALRAALHVRNERLGSLLAELTCEGLLAREASGWRRVPVPLPCEKAERNGGTTPP